MFVKLAKMIVDPTPFGREKRGRTLGFLNGIPRFGQTAVTAKEFEPGDQFAWNYFKRARLA